MSKHPNVAVIDRMTEAVFDNDRETLTGLFDEDVTLHVRGPLPCAGDHRGIDGFLGALGRIFELTDGDVKIEQLFCLADDHWAAECVFGWLVEAVLTWLEYGDPSRDEEFVDRTTAALTVTPGGRR